MSAVQITTSVTVINSLNGFQAVSLSAMDTASALTILAGSVLEVSGAFFSWPTSETPSASSWTAIATGATAYLVCTPSGSAGSQIVVTTFSDAAPTWVGSKCEWYASAASNVRVIAYVEKTATAEYSHKEILLPYQTIGMMPPVGAIMAWMPGYFTDASNGSYTAVRTVATHLPAPWKLCNGAALNDAFSPIWTGAGRYLPNLTDDRFIQGDTEAAVGGIGGSNTMVNHTHGSHNHTMLSDATGTLPPGDGTGGTGMFVTKTGADYTLKAANTPPATLSLTGGATVGSGDANPNSRPVYLSAMYIVRVK